MTRRSLPRFLAVALLIGALSSCLSTDTTVALRSDGSGTLSLTYRIDRAAWETGVFDDSDVARPIPVTRSEFEDAELAIEGLRLHSHSIVKSESEVTVIARVGFGSIDALRRFLGRDSLEVKLAASGGSWRQTIAPGDGSSGEGARALAADLEGYALTFEVDPPAQVARTNGEIVDGGEAAAFTVTLSEIVTATSPIVWEVGW
ncbi:MAG: hypothetical protein ACOC2Y_06565 [Spirochaetota bacterium]